MLCRCGLVGGFFVAGLVKLLTRMLPRSLPRADHEDRVGDGVRSPIPALGGTQTDSSSAESVLYHCSQRGFA